MENRVDSGLINIDNKFLCVQQKFKSGEFPSVFDVMPGV